MIGEPRDELTAALPIGCRPLGGPAAPPDASPVELRERQYL
jgi:hypothetical protein